MAADYLLEIEGAPGESTDKKHAGTIEIRSFNWGATNSGSHSDGGGGGAGKVSFQDVHFTSRVNKASPLLMLACASGKHIKKAVLYVRKQGGDQQDYYEVTMEDLLVSSYETGGSEGSDTVPVDHFALNFTKIKFSYKPQKPDGTPDSAIEATWNVKTNSP